MIDYHCFCQIKHLHEHQGLNASQIATALGPRSSHGGLLARPGALPPPQSHGTHASKLDPFKAQIVRMLERYPYSAAQVFQRLREQGFDGGYSIVKAYVRTVRPRRQPAFLTLAFAPGECAQVDWGSFGCGPGGANESPPELLCHGAVLQPHDVCGVHRLPDHGALPGLPPTRL